MASQLKAVEDDFGAAEVELVCGDALDDLGEGPLQCGAIGRRGEGEGPAGDAAGAASVPA